MRFTKSTPDHFYTISNNSFVTVHVDVGELCNIAWKEIVHIAVKSEVVSTIFMTCSGGALHCPSWLPVTNNFSPARLPTGVEEVLGGTMVFTQVAL